MTLPGTVHLGNASVFLDMNSEKVMFSFATSAARNRFGGTGRFVSICLCLCLMYNDTNKKHPLYICVC